MNIDVLETRINNCENNLKISAHQLNDVAEQLKSVADKIHENEKILTKIAVLQDRTTEDVKNLEHNLKNTDIAQEMLDSRYTKLEVQQQTRRDFFKNWHVMVALGIGIFGAFMSIYDRFADHIRSIAS